MNIYLNPDNKGFKETLTRKIYVDKTMLISELNKFIDESNKYICVSRPRRFGFERDVQQIEDFKGEKLRTISQQTQFYQD